MPITFRGSPTPTIGVEMELMIVDAATGDLRCAAPDVLEASSRVDPGHALARIKPEIYGCTIEINTDVCHSVTQAIAQLGDSIDAITAILRPHGLALISSGLHPWARWQDLTVSQDERHLWLVETIQWPARQLVAHGVHVHVAVPDGDTAISVQNQLTSYLPLLLALSASSPFRDGADSGLASARMTVMDQLPMSGPPPPLTRWSDFERFVAAMTASRTITSVREVWWEVRPHADFGTVETRIFDAPSTLAETAAVTALTHCLVTQLAADFRGGTPAPRLPDWVVTQNIWRATRHGVECDLLVDDQGRTRPARELIPEVVALLTPTAVALRCEAELLDVLRILHSGPSTCRQRGIVASGGTLRDVVASLRGELQRGRPLEWP